MYEIKKFTFEEKIYEVRIASDGHTTRIRVFLNDKPANGYSYSVDLEKEIDAKMDKSLTRPLDEMIKTAINDVEEKIWEQYLEAIRLIQSK